MVTCGIWARPAAGQPEPIVGVRAAGMGGAFTAVADDASAPVWNPAGLASGSIISVVLDGSAFDHGSPLLISLGSPPLGVVYYKGRLAPAAAATSTGGDTNGRNGVTAHHAGVSVVQSIGDRGLAVGSTLKYVRGNGRNGFDADAGVMLSGALGQIGLVVHHLTEPQFGDFQLERRVRAGIAIHVSRNATVAGDMEMTTSTAPQGEWRDAALGVEAHPHRAVWLRTGVHWNTAGDIAAPVGSVGASYAVYGSLMADAQWSFGSAAGERGWGVGLRFTY